jgi:dUTP pyrophosphatase
MDRLPIRLQRLSPLATPPSQASSGAAGYDLTAISVEHNAELNSWTYDTGIALEIPTGYEGQLRARSSISRRGAYMAMGVGTIDSDYRGPIRAVFISKLQPYAVGERIAQLVVARVEACTFESVDQLSETDRGLGGFGSTGTGSIPNVR